MPAGLFDPALLNARLDGPPDRPVGVAVSGGSDSLALLHALAMWGARPLQVLHVDHGINPLSERWAAHVEREARRLGVGWSLLPWRGEKPTTGLSAAARRARHALVAEEARRLGISVILMAHTRDDRAEAALMRQWGSTVGMPLPWSPSPVWPEGRGVFLYRPLLDHGRKELRDWLTARGVEWIDDPANENPASLRARARKALAQSPYPPHDSCTDAPSLDRDRVDLSGAGRGMLRLDLKGMDEAAALRLLSAAVVCAGGGEALPDKARVRRALERFSFKLNRNFALDICFDAHFSPKSASHFSECAPERAEMGQVTTLAGSRIGTDGEMVEVVREAGDIARRGVPDLSLPPHSTGVWDGRFEVSNPTEAEVLITPARALGAALSKETRRELLGLPAAVRPSQPVARQALEPAQWQSPERLGLSVSSLVGGRLRAATGDIRRESEIAMPWDAHRD